MQLITEASDVQAEGIQQVTIGIDQISSVIQTNSATAQQSAAASEELASQANLLRTLVGRFHLKGMAAPMIEQPEPINNVPDYNNTEIVDMDMSYTPSSIPEPEPIAAPVSDYTPVPEKPSKTYTPVSTSGTVPFRNNMDKY